MDCRALVQCKHDNSIVVRYLLSFATVIIVVIGNYERSPVGAQKRTLLELPQNDHTLLTTCLAFFSESKSDYSTTICQVEVEITVPQNRCAAIMKNPWIRQTLNVKPADDQVRANTRAQDLSNARVPLHVDETETLPNSHVEEVYSE